MFNPNKYRKEPYLMDGLRPLVGDTQPYANSFWGDVVLDTSNNVSRDEDNILDQIFIMRI